MKRVTRSSSFHRMEIILRYFYENNEKMIIFPGSQSSVYPKIATLNLLMYRSENS